MGNRLGAGGATAADQVCRATPDGSTLLIAVASTHGVNPGVFPDLPYDAERDFAAVALLGVTGFVPVVRADAGFADLAALIARLRPRLNAAFSAALASPSSPRRCARSAPSR